MSAIQEDMLGQLRPADTNPASLYSPPNGITWIAKTLIVCNTSGSAATFRLFHSKAGTTYDETTALFWDGAIAADTALSYTVFMAGKTSNGNVACQSSVGDALTFTLYGAEIVA